MEEIIVIPRKQFEAILYSTIKRVESEKIKNAPIERTISVNELSKKIGRSHNTTKKLVEGGLFKKTPDGRILVSSISKYYNQI